MKTYRVDSSRLPVDTPVADYINKGGNRLPCRGDLDHIQIIHTLERTEAWDDVLADVEKSLRPEGTVCIDVLNHARFADHIGGGRAIVEVTYPTIFGTDWRQGSTHILNLDDKPIIEIVEQYGLKNIGVGSESYYNRYLFAKPKVQSTIEYAPPPSIEPEARVLEIGPGTFPFLRADVYFDHDRRFLDPLAPKPTFCGDLKDGLPFPDKSFDYVWCSHVIEHLDDPINVLTEISRVGKAGSILAPSIFKEFLFHYEEDDHKWDILPPAVVGGPIRFIRPDMAWREKIKDRDVQAGLCGLYRTDDFRTRRQRLMRNWFRQNEPLLDVVVHWRGSVAGVIL